ncbi:AbrB family transcriptional regulator, partial [Aliarcobacter cryaerophilus]|uniref:AbrB family transcriptional regulator n=1 Tax=Aliarcobacter cryaerophilus TaxID=28198 RepID=UPI003DA24F97
VLKYDLKTSYLGSMPGGVIEIVIIGQELKANTAQITLMQSSRLFFVVVSLPFIIQYIFQIDIRGNQLLTTPIKDIDILEFLYIYILGVLAALFAKKIKLTAAYLIGPMIISIILYSSGFVTTHIPDELLKFIQVVFGSIIGFTFKNIDLKTIFNTLVATLGHFVILIILCGIFIFIIHHFFGFTTLDILLAFGPGGQTEINLIALLVGANLPYITLHHIVRLFLVMNIAPIIAKRLK